MRDAILILFSGHDQPGLSASLTRILAEHRVCILDIGQAVVHEVLALGMLVEVAEAENFGRVQDALIERCRALDLQVRFMPVSAAEMDHWISIQARNQYILSILGRGITSKALESVTTIVAQSGLNIDRIDRLSSPLSLASHLGKETACIELRMSGDAIAEGELRAALLQVTLQEEIDIAFQRESIFRRNRRLFAFDMDSTLIQGEVIDELAKRAGVADEVTSITRAAMRGEMDFTASFRRRVALLKGLPQDQVYGLLDSIPLVDGADRLIRTLKLLGYKTAILSGGFRFFGEHLQARLGIDYVFANELLMEDGRVTGEAGANIIDGPAKAALLRQITARECISLEQVVAVGDGANDLPMLKIAGMGIAFHAKPVVRESADHSLSLLGLDSLLYLIGVRDRDLERHAT